MGKNFERFFYYGIEDEKSVLEGILYFEFKKLFGEKMDIEKGDKQVERKIQIWVRGAKNIYKQFYRFVVLNNPSATVELTERAAVNEAVWGTLKELTMSQENPMIHITEQTISYNPEYVKKMDGQKSSNRKKEDSSQSWVKEIYEELREIKELERNDKQSYEKKQKLVRDRRKLQEGIKTYLYNEMPRQRTVLQAMMYIEFQKLFQEKYMQYASTHLYKVNKARQANILMQRTKAVYKQFFRFVILNNAKGIYQDQVKDEELEETLKSVLKESIISTQAGIYFPREIVEKDMNADIKAKSIYQLMQKLQELEKTDPIEYYARWLDVKKHRAIQRADREEIESIEWIEKAFQDRKAQIIEQTEEKMYVEEAEIG